MLSYFQEIRFVNPEFLLLFLAVPLAWWWHRRLLRRSQPTIRLTSLHQMPPQPTWRTRLRSMLPLLQLMTFSLFIVAIARPQRTLRLEDVKSDGIDIFLVMDISSSMLARDFNPDRLEVSKKVAAEFVDKRPYDRIGLAVFSGEAFTQCPLTTDHTVVKEMLANLQPGILEDGTAIGMGLATAVNRIKYSPAKSKVIILLTDGVNNAGYIQPLTAAQIAREFGVKVYTIGVGTEGEALTPVRKRPDGQFIFGMALVEIDEELLRQIASQTEAQYFRATSETALSQVYQEIDRLEKTEIQVTTFKRYSDEFPQFLLLGLMFLLLEFFLIHFTLRSIP